MQRHFNRACMQDVREFGRALHLEQDRVRLCQPCEPHGDFSPHQRRGIIHGLRKQHFQCHLNPIYPVGAQILNGQAKFSANRLIQPR